MSKNNLFNNILENNIPIITNSAVLDDNEITFRTNGVDRVSIGVTGVTSFGRTLDTTQTDKIAIYDSVQPFIRWQNDNTDKDTRLGFDTDNNFQINSLGDTEIKMLTQNINRLVVTNDGNVNIGTTVTEEARLSVCSETNAAEFPDMLLESMDENDVFVKWKNSQKSYSFGIDQSNSNSLQLSESDKPGGGNNRICFKGNNIGCHTVNPVAPLHVYQNSSGGEPVLELEQDDIDQPFVDYDGTVGANSTNSISSFTTGNSVNGHIQIFVNGVKKWLRYYDNPTS
jgi:hypothetical protein